jgi:hypothetical protein
MKVSKLDMDMLDTLINKRKYKLEKEYKWQHEDKYLKSLLNEKSRRILKIRGNFF